MPRKFTQAVKSGAKVRTQTLPHGRYRHIAIKGRKTVARGEIHTKKGR